MLTRAFSMRRRKRGSFSSRAALTSGRRTSFVRDFRTVLAMLRPLKPCSFSPTENCISTSQIIALYLQVMAETFDNLVLEHLRAIRNDLGGLKEDMRELKSRLGTLEEQYASVSRRLDRLDERTSRIERRLELTPTP